MNDANQSLFFRHVSDKIRSATAAANALVHGTSHKGIHGHIREIAVKECLRPFLTQSFRCGSGIVIDSLGERSDQIDAIVYDCRTIPEIFIGEGVGYHPVESVRYVFEVKTRLTASTLKDAMKKFESMRRLKCNPRISSDGTQLVDTLPAAVLFAFGSDITGSELQRFRRYYPGLHAPISAICVLGKGYWIQSGDGEWGGRVRRERDPEFLEFCQLITGFMNTLAAAELKFRPFSPGKYMGNYPDIDQE